jgi:hypothetical protein
MFNLELDFTNLYIFGLLHTHAHTYIYVYYNIQYMLFIYRIEYAMIYLIVDDIWWNIISK